MSAHDGSHSERTSLVHGPLGKGGQYLVGLGLGLVPIILWFVVAFDDLHRRDLMFVVIGLLQAECLEAVVCLFFKRTRYIGYGLLTPLPVGVFLLLGL